MTDHDSGLGFWAKTGQDAKASTKCRRRGGLALLAVTVAVVGALTAHLIVGSSLAPARSVAGAIPAAPMVASARSVPEDQFITTAGQTASLASFRGRPTMVWFVVAGCASCAASIPVVAGHLGQLQAEGMRVVVLDLYGDLDPGAKGGAELAQFGHAAAGSAYSNPTWIWGVASKALSYAYDPSGTPDEYFLLGRTGHIRYANSVPVSTMAQLLSHAASVSHEA